MRIGHDLRLLAGKRREMRIRHNLRLLAGTAFKQLSMRTYENIAIIQVQIDRFELDSWHFGLTNTVNTRARQQLHDKIDTIYPHTTDKLQSMLATFELQV